MIALGGRTSLGLVIAGLALEAWAGLWVGDARAQDKPGQKSVAPEDSKPAQAEVEARPQNQAEEPASPGQPDPEEIINQLKRDQALNVPIPPIREKKAEEQGTDHFFQQVSPNAELEPLLPEGAYLVDRAGRLVKRGDWWTFALEDRGEVVRSRPMRILPSQLLETMEYASANGTGDVVFVVSGELTEFHGLNYVLLRKVLIQRALGNLGG